MRSTQLFSIYGFSPDIRIASPTSFSTPGRNLMMLDNEILPPHALHLPKATHNLLNPVEEFGRE